MKKVVLAFSGGLDTSYCAQYLSSELGYEVHSVAVNTGGFSKEEEKHLEERAKALGVSSHVCLNVEQEFYEKGIRYLLFGNVLKNHTYPLSVSAERVFQAVAIAEYAKSLEAEAIAHGSTGAGNDQVRFDLVFNVMAPEMEIITPIRDMKLSREQEVAYLEEHGVSYEWKKAKYSINQGLWGTSVGGAETLSSDLGLPEEAWPVQITKEEEETITIGFEKGEPVSLDGKSYDPVALIRALQDKAAPFGIGRDIHVGDTIIGIKGRVGFEAAAPLVLIESHRLLEKHVLGKWQIHWKDQLSDWYGMLMHEGQFLDPCMRDIEVFLTNTQQRVTGEVIVTLYKKGFELQGVRSGHDMMQAGFGQYGEMNEGWTGDDVKGFTRILGNASLIHQRASGEDS